MIIHGFDWLSYTNDDAANYCLGASRLISNGLTTIPDYAAIAEGKNYSLYSWFFHVPGNVRPGGELLLAWICGLTGLFPSQIYMPVIFAVNLSMICAAASLAPINNRFKHAADITLVSLSLAALNLLGTLFQLLPQVAGMSFLVGSQSVSSIYLNGSVNKASSIRVGILLGIILSGLLTTYSEVSPFLFSTVGLLLAIKFIQKRLAIKHALVTLSTTLIVVLVILNTYIFTVLRLVFMQLRIGFSKPNVELLEFPYFLIPSGHANLWGVLGLGVSLPEPLLSTLILFCVLLSIATLLAATKLALNGQIAPIAVIFMFTLGARLVASMSDYGSFKLAMYLQPYLWCTLSVGLAALWYRFRIVKPLLLLFGILALTNSYVQQVYLRRSVSRLTDAPYLTISKMNSSLKQIGDLPKPARVIADTSNTFSAKILASAATSTFLTFIGRNFFKEIGTFGSNETFPNWLAQDKRLSLTSANLIKSLNAKSIETKFQLFNSQQPFSTFHVQTFGQNSPEQFDCDQLISLAPQGEILNRSYLASNPKVGLHIRNCDSVNNHLMFVDTDIGAHYYLAGKKPVAIYPLEPDITGTADSMAAIGRYVLLQALHPTKNSRVVLELSASLNADGDLSLPASSLIGEKRIPFDVVGRGAARLVSQPIPPQLHHGRSYFGIDMGREVKMFPERRSGFMKLYGQNIRLDKRKFVGFVRNISLITESSFTEMPAPEGISQFPQDLANPSLEFSGIYENGYLSEDCYVYLNKPPDLTHLIIQGEVPSNQNSSYRNYVQVLVDGSLLLQRNLGSGSFNLNLPVNLSAGRHKIALQFSQPQQLSPKDSRLVSARVKFIGFK